MLRLGNAKADEPIHSPLHLTANPESSSILLEHSISSLLSRLPFHSDPRRIIEPSFFVPPPADYGTLPGSARYLASSLVNPVAKSLPGSLDLDCSVMARLISIPALCKLPRTCRYVRQILSSPRFQASYPGPPTLAPLVANTAPRDSMRTRAN